MVVWLRICGLSLSSFPILFCDSNVSYRMQIHANVRTVVCCSKLIEIRVEKQCREEEKLDFGNRSPELWGLQTIRSGDKDTAMDRDTDIPISWKIKTQEMEPTAQFGLGLGNGEKDFGLTFSKNIRSKDTAIFKASTQLIFYNSCFIPLPQSR